MRLALSFYCLGILCATYTFDVEKTLLLCMLLLLIILPVKLLNSDSPVAFHLLSRGFIAFLLGVSVHLLWALHGLNSILDAELEGESLLVTGVVNSLPVNYERYQSFHFWIQEGPVNIRREKVSLNYYGYDEIIPGQIRSFEVKLMRPHGYANPGGFDYEAAMLQQNIIARGYVRESPANQLHGESLFSIARLRFVIRKRIIEHSGTWTHPDIILALTIGDASLVKRDTWALLSDTGTNHLFVISGLHIGFISFIAYWLIAQFIGHFPFLLPRVPMQRIAALGAIAAALVYAFLSGFALPAQRALVMIGVFMLAGLIDRPIPVSHRFLLSLTVVLTINPLAALNPGFWLSFMAVGALLLFVPRLKYTSEETSTLPAKKLLMGYMQSQLVIFIALALPLLLWMQSIPILAPLINLIAIPLVAWLLVPLCLLAVFVMPLSQQLSTMLFSVIDLILQQVFIALGLLLQLVNNFGNLDFGISTAGQIICLLIIVLIWLLPRGLYSRCFTIPLLLPLFFLWSETQRLPQVEMHVLDVGQGLSVVLKTANHAMLFDAGAGLDESVNLGVTVVTPALKKLQVSALDRIVISHGDNDHLGGVYGVLAQIPTAEIYGSNSVSLPGLDIWSCHSNNSWNWDGVTFRFFSNDEEKFSSNNNSCVLQVSVGEMNILLPGDIETEAEHQLVRRYGNKIQSEIIVAPHHGSATSSSYAFLKSLAADHVVYSAGYRNSFGHPNSNIVDRYNEFGVQSFESSNHGMISFTVKAGEEIDSPMLFRTENKRYWRVF